MDGNNGFVTESAFNRYVNLDNIEWHIIDYLAKSRSKYATYLWKILKYNTEDCLTLPFLVKEDGTEETDFEKIYKERIKLVYKGNGEASGFKVFFTPFIDDSFEEQCSMLHIYVDSLEPKERLQSSVNVCFECIVHNKISNILGDASEYNELSNPSELHDGLVTTPYKSRATEFLKNVIACLNGEFVNGVGVLQFNSQVSRKDLASASLWNGKKFFGYKIIMSSLISGVSGNSDCGW